MIRFRTILLCRAFLWKSCVALCLTIAAVPGSAAHAQDTDATTTPQPAKPSAVLQLPPSPSGKATVLGGRIGNLDPVRDQFTLKVYGGSPIKILYDARTQVYRDGVRAPLRSLRPEERASVETTLDGTSVFALKIHMLSQVPESECRGQVRAHDTGSGLLEVRCDLTEKPVTFGMPSDVAILLIKQDGHSYTIATPADLTTDSLVLVHFKPGDRGQGVATKVSILARPGSSFIFTGDLLSLDLPAGHMVVADGTDGASYSISFTPGNLLGSGDVQQGVRVSIAASFNGSGYVASSIKRD